MDEIAEAIAALLFEKIKTGGHNCFHIALSGGNTPKAIFSYLEKKYGNKLADKRFHFWWGDERCVPPGDDDSNYKWAYTLWLKPVGIPDKNIHRILGENDPAVEVKRYSQEMKQFIPEHNGFPVIDLNLLGLGEDGHTASIFPDNMELLHSEQWCAVATHPSNSQKRITMTGNVLSNSKTIVFVSTGKSKADMVQKVAINKESQYPASHIKPTHGRLIWMLDQDAASKV
jgi:6-phosphogluconolactonase